MSREIEERISFGAFAQTVLLTCLLSQPVFAQDVAVAPGDTKPNQGIAVVELFTSQGCSSCPPADEVLQEIASVAAEDKLPVYVLSFHVDYWNLLGWTDPYSHAACTRRQRAYASATRSQRIYTPQMIVNGTTEFVGSHRSKALKAVTESLRQASAVDVAIQVKRHEMNQRIDVTYETSGTAIGQWLHLAVVNSPDVNSVPRGENVGRQLSHVNVVRSFQSRRIERSTGSIEMSVPEGVVLADTHLIAYIQDPKTLAIVGATASN